MENIPYLILFVIAAVIAIAWIFLPFLLLQKLNELIKLTKAGNVARAEMLLNQTNPQPPAAAQTSQVETVWESGSTGQNS